jgi:hypothetical protein
MGQRLAAATEKQSEKPQSRSVAPGGALRRVLASKRREGGANGMVDELPPAMFRPPTAFDCWKRDGIRASHLQFEDRERAIAWNVDRSGDAPGGRPGGDHAPPDRRRLDERSALGIVL